MFPFSKTSAGQFIPFEIIHKIFAHHTTALLIYSGRIPNTFPWFLGHVCSSWRTVFLSMYAEFWSSLITLPQGPPSTVNEKRSLDFVSTFMERTKGRPISLSLRLHYMPRPVIEIFVQHCKQWQHVELVFEQQQLSLLSSIKNQLPLLCSLRLGFSSTLLLTGSPKPIVLFENAPRLTHVQLDYLSRWCFYWPSLSTLALHDLIKVDMLLETLLQLENLETLQIEQSSFDREITNLTMPITMTRLKVLRTYCSMTLAVLTAPSLEVLRIGLCDDWCFSRVCSAFFRRSACRLLELSLGNCDTESLDTILPFVPIIETLYLGCDVNFHNNGTLRNFFHVLACHPGEPLQLPQLQTIMFSMSSPIMAEDVTALRSMITLRTLGPCPKMQKIVILPRKKVYEVQDQVVLRMLEKLRQECEIQGIQIKIKLTSDADLLFLYDCFNMPFTTRLYTAFYRVMV